MKLLVTGADGQLGSTLRRRLEQEPSIAATYTDRAELDLTDAAAVAQFVADGRFSHIVNCAGYTAVDMAETDQQACRAGNVTAVGNLASAARDHDCRMIHISTDYVFDGQHTTPYTESDRVNPISEYGRSKRAGEMLMLDMQPDGIILRTSGLYSPRGHNFVKTMCKLASTGVRPKVVIDQTVSPTSAIDLADAIVKIMRSPRWIGGIFNYSNMGATTWFDIAVEVFRFMGRNPEDVGATLTRDYGSPAARPAYSVLSKALIRSTYSLTIPHWRKSLESCLDQMRRDNII